MSCIKFSSFQVSSMVDCLERYGVDCSFDTDAQLSNAFGELIITAIKEASQEQCLILIKLAGARA
jgi:hypothetical protein